jgi:hypothetical protein
MPKPTQTDDDEGARTFTTTGAGAPWVVDPDGPLARSLRTDGWLDPTAAQALRAERDAALGDCEALRDNWVDAQDEWERLLPVAEAARVVVNSLTKTTWHQTWPRQVGKTALTEVLQPLIAAVDEWQKAGTDGD